MIPREEEASKLPPLGSQEAEDYLWTMSDVCLELTHNYGSETDDNFQVR
jgi:hypothetical protein